MKCDQCEQEATVHEVTIKSGKKVEKHLCEACAKKQGIAVQAGMPIQELLNKYVLAQAGTTPAKAAACPSCSLAYTEFRQHGLLGCPDCYKAFEGLLGPLLERAHEGATHHVGKSPRRAGRGGEAGAESITGGPKERAERLSILQKQLDQAVRAEQYEKAAKLRDEIRREAESAPPPAAKARRRKEPEA
ncbi:MAG: UvrB/UvrC motif-containing protein [Phycisphaerales bacterium]|nr:UvrB/UvrC motif-containing protein [Phycisphaerales bacterium]